MAVYLAQVDELIFSDLAKLHLPRSLTLRMHKSSSSQRLNVYIEAWALYFCVYTRAVVNSRSLHKNVASPREFDSSRKILLVTRARYIRASRA